MKELGLVLFGCLAFSGFFATVIYPELEYKGYPRNSSCTGECYEEYVRQNGNVVEQLKAKQAQAAGDPFSSVRGLWSGCAACHGQDGGGIGAFPKLSGQSAGYITDRLNSYKNKETIGPMSSTMWAQAGMLTEEQIKTLSEFIEVEL